MSSFWSGWIIVLTLGYIAFLFVLLLGNRSRPNTDQATTGHNFDGIEEYDNPMPRWWLWMFLLLMVYGLGYLVYYPGLGSWKGTSGWTQVGQLQEEMKKRDEQYNPLLQQYSTLSFDEMLNNEEALRSGQRIFASYCSVCHGSDGRGAKGFPNLTDSEWMWGGQPEQIVETITNGRIGAMPAWKGQLTDAQIDGLARMIVKAEGDHAEAEQVYGMFCATCHGQDHKGMQTVGAPDLTNDIWLYGGSLGEVKATITHGRNGRMPAHADLLSPDKIKLVAGYVYSLSKQAEQAPQQ